MSKKSTVVETGLGDQQYNTITTNQGSIASSIDDGFNNAAKMGAELATGQETITGNQQVLADGQGTIAGNQETLKTGQGTIIGNQGALTTGQADILKAVQSAPTVDLSGVTSSISSLEGVTTAGFDSMGTRFDTVDSGLGSIQGAVDTGFEGVNSTLDTMGGNITTGFDGVNEAVGAGFTTAEENRAAMQELLATGQITMTDLINKYGEQGATYYADLAQNQASLLDGQAGLQTGLSAFQDTYNQNVDMDSKRMGELQDQLTGGFDAVRTGQSGLSDAVGNVADATTASAATQAVSGVAQNQQSQDIDYARIAKEVATGVSNQNDASFNDGTMFANKLDTIRNILTNQGDQLDGRIRDQYTKLANSFDQQGRLISSEVGQNGVQTARAIDAQGNLLMAAFDQTGQRIMQESMNINQLMTGLDRTVFQRGGNYDMGNLSPAYNRRGLGAPFSRSY